MCSRCNCILASGKDAIDETAYYGYICLECGFKSHGHKCILIQEEEVVKMSKIIIEVRGSEESKKQALQGLLEDASSADLRDVVRSLPTHKLVALAQYVHGAIYRTLGHGK